MGEGNSIYLVYGVDVCDEQTSPGRVTYDCVWRPKVVTEMK